MPFEFFDHTGDIGVRVRAGSLDELFAEAAAALTATLVDPTSVERRLREWAALEASSLDLLLVDWLNDLVFRFDVDEFLVAHTEPRVVRQGDGWKLEATLEGEKVDPRRHRVRVLVKGATYHRLAITETPQGFETSIVFDI
jgi:SHS2 domain-containing protein